MARWKLLALIGCGFLVTLVVFRLASHQEAADTEGVANTSTAGTVAVPARPATTERKKPEPLKTLDPSQLPAADGEDQAAQKRYAEFTRQQTELVAKTADEATRRNKYKRR
jgi:hypothetical protein